MFNLFSLNKNLKQLKLGSLEDSSHEESNNYLPYKYNCYSPKSFEYLFVQSFLHFKTFRLKDVQKFVSTYFDYYYFKSDLLKHFLMHVCVPLEQKNSFRLRHLNWEKYFRSETLDIRLFDETVKPKE